MLSPDFPHAAARLFVLLLGSARRRLTHFALSPILRVCTRLPAAAQRLSCLHSVLLSGEEAGGVRRRAGFSCFKEIKDLSRLSFHRPQARADTAQKHQELLQMPQARNQ